MNQPNQKPYPSNTSHLLALLFISFLLHLTIQVTADSGYNPIENIALDCGSLGGYYFGRSWIGDINYSPIEKTKTSFTSDAKNLSPTQVTPYSNARVSASEFTYSFSLTAGPKFIRLYFYFSDYKNFTRADAFFNVKLSGGFTLLNNFSAAASANSLPTEGLSREFCVFVESSQLLNLTFTPVTTSYPNSYAFVNGIEVISMPDELYFKPVVYTNSSLEGIRFIGQKNLYSYSNILLLDLIRRLNVGGSTVDAARDTGMYRVWEDDLDYVSSRDFKFD